MSQNEKVDYDAIIREYERTAYESDLQYRQMVAEHERQIAAIFVQGQMEAMRALHQGMVDALRPRARRVTVAM